MSTPILREPYEKHMCESNSKKSSLDGLIDAALYHVLGLFTLTHKYNISSISAISNKKKFVLLYSLFECNMFIISGLVLSSLG